MMYTKLLLALAVSWGAFEVAIAQDNGTDFGDAALALDPNNVQDASQEDGLDTAEDGELPSET